MDYSINKTTLYNLIDYEVSLAADGAVAQDGTSLYDDVVLSSKDQDEVYRHIDDAVSSLVARTSDIATYGTNVISFYVPDIPSGNSSAISNVISRYIALYVTTEILKARMPGGLVETYAGLTSEAANAVMAALRTRTAPTRS